MGAEMSRDLHSREPRIGQHLGRKAGCPVDPVLVTRMVLAYVLAELNGMAFKERGHPLSRMRCLDWGW